MSERKEVENRIFGATTDLETARTILQVTMEYFHLSDTNLTMNERQTIGCSTEAIGVMLNAVDDYVARATSTLEVKGGAE